jgi:uncharacterized protein (DUF1499 family)
MEEQDGDKTRNYSPFAIIGFILAVLAGIAEIAAGLGSRWGVWHFRTGLIILRWAAYSGIVAVLVLFAGSIFTLPGQKRRGFAWSVTGLLIGIVVVGIPWFYWHRAQQAPPIHDITTDVVNPPGFVSILPLRRDAINPAGYGGPEIGAKQRSAFPDIVPLELSIPASQAFKRALRVARSMDWQIVDVNQLEGRIEATDTTLWFGFKDDIVIRVTPIHDRSRIDLRSVSRVGKSDLGTNARRIREFLKELKEMG